MSESSSQHPRKWNQPRGSWQYNIPPPAPGGNRKYSATFLTCSFVSSSPIFCSHMEELAQYLLKLSPVFFSLCFLCAFFCHSPLFHFFHYKILPKNCLARCRAFLRVLGNGKNEFCLLILGDVWKHKCLNIVLSYHMCMSTIYWVCHQPCLHIDPPPHHISMVIQMLICFFFLHIPLFPSPLFYSCPSQGDTQISIDGFKEKSGGKKTDVACPTHASSFLGSELQPGLGKGLGYQVASWGECGSPHHHPRKRATSFNPSTWRVSEERWGRDLWVQKRGEPGYASWTETESFHRGKCPCGTFRQMGSQEALIKLPGAEHDAEAEENLEAAG